MRDSSQSQLLCTFTTLREYEKEIQIILRTYKVDGGKVYVIQSQLDESHIFLTYNVEKVVADRKRPRTISVHRKRDYNVIYSINALNVIVLEQGGNFDSGFQIDWSLYRNSLVVANDKNIQVIPTKLLSIFVGNS